jgi:lauroyl/myristoyl acyltransferase
MPRINPLVPGDHDRWATADPAWPAATYDAYDRFALALTSIHAPTGIRVLDALGYAAHWCAFHAPSPADLTQLYGPLPPARVRRIARHVAALRFKNRAAIAMVERVGVEALARLIRDAHIEGLDGFDGEKRSGILLAWHVGAMFGVRAALHRAGVATLTLRDLPIQSTAARASALKRAVDHVRAGGLVIAVPDGPGGENTGEVECLGRRIVLRRGPFMLARVTGAPLIPIVAKWEADGYISVRAARPLDRCSSPKVASCEDELCRRAAQWLGEYLVAEPEQIWLWTLRSFLEAPLARG